MNDSNASKKLANNQRLSRGNNYQNYSSSYKSNNQTLASDYRANQNNLSNMEGLADNSDIYKNEELENDNVEQEEINTKDNKVTESKDVQNDYDDNDFENNEAKVSNDGEDTFKKMEQSAKLGEFLIKHPHIAMVVLVVGGVFLAFMLIILVVVILGSSESSASGTTAGTTGGSNTNNNYASASAKVTDACPQLNQPVDEFLSSKGSSLEEFNNYIASEVRNAGLGTREGVVAAAVSLLGGLCQNYGVRFPYTMGGAHPPNFYGAKALWGSSINNGAGEMRYGYGPYFYEGPDCSGFVAWAIYNGGFKIGNMVAENFGSLGEVHSMSEFTGKPGDILYNEHHVVIIVGESGGKYLIAEASSGDNGSRITTESKKSNNYKIVDMTSYYVDANKDIASYPEVTTVPESPTTGENNGDSTDSGNENNPTLIIGDSRTVMMCETFGLCGSDKHIAKVGMGYNWLVSDALYQADDILGDNSTKYNIFINLGANDYDYQANNYIAKINELAKGKWKSHALYYVSVGPMSDGSDNNAIASFNQKIKDGVASSGVKYCDVYSDLQNNGYNATDGVHYDKSTSERIYNMIKGCI